MHLFGLFLPLLGHRSLGSLTVLDMEDTFGQLRDGHSPKTAARGPGRPDPGWTREESIAKTCGYCMRPSVCCSEPRVRGEGQAAGHAEMKRARPRVPDASLVHVVGGMGRGWSTSVASV